MAGVGTVLADDPRLTVRGVRRGRDPIRIIVDSRLRTPPQARILPANTASEARVVIATTDRAARARQRRLESAGAEVWRIGTGPRVDLSALAARLHESEIISVLAEGGGQLHGSLIEAGIADEIILYVAPIAVGGDSPLWMAGRGVDSLVDARRFRFVGPPSRLGDDLMLVARAR